MPAALAFLAGALVGAAAQTPLLAALSVPQSDLGIGCRVAAAPTRQLSGNRIQSGLWAGLPIDHNPWIGSDPAVIAAIRERIDPPQRLPDGPPLDAAQLARYRLQLADGVKQAYAAVYVSADANVLVTVLGLEFLTDQDAQQFVASAKPTGELVTLSRAVATAQGSGSCRDVVAAHVRSLR